MMTKDNYFIDDIEDLKEILSEITDINAPVNKNLATLLHLCCIMVLGMRHIIFTVLCQKIWGMQSVKNYLIFSVYAKQQYGEL